MKVGIVDECGAQVLFASDDDLPGRWWVQVTNSDAHHFSNYFQAVVATLTKAHARDVGDALLKFAGEP